MLQLEKLSYYQHLSLSGGQERPIYSCRVVDIRGSRYHALSRIQDAGLDFTGRTNFLAHHLIFTPEEIRQFPSPPVILRGWAGWVKAWPKEPQLLEHEDWTGLAGLAGSVSVPATNWQQLTGDAINGYGLLEARAGIAFRVDNLTEERVLALFAESLEMLEIRDPRRDYRTTAWQYTFTTSMQEQDNPPDFRWRCLHADNPASNRFAGPDCRPLSDVRAVRPTSEETTFARSGRQPPRFVIQPKNVRITEGEEVRFHAKADGVPAPGYQWFTLDRAGNGKIIADGTSSELVVQNPPLGLSRYIVRASNSQGDASSGVAELSVERKIRLSQQHPVSVISEPSKPVLPSYVKSADDIGRQRRRLEAEGAEKLFRKKQQRMKLLMVCGLVGALALLGIASWIWVKRQQSPQTASSQETTSSNPRATAESLPVPAAPDPTGTVSAKNQLKPSEASDASQTPATVPKHQNSMPPPTSYDLPAGWMQVKIGNVSNPNAEFISKRYNLSANAEGFAPQGDNSWFVYITNIMPAFQASLIRNDGRNETPPDGSVCGVMARESEKANATFLFIGASSSQIITYRRDGAGRFDSKTNNIPKTDLSKSVHFCIQMDATNIVPLYSFDGPKRWQGGGLSNAISKGTPMMLGLAISSGSSSNKVVAKFGAVSGQ